MVTLQIALYGGACHAIMASASVVAHASALPRSLGALKWATCAVKGAQFQRVQVPPRQGSSRPGSHRSGGGGDEAVGAWETVAAKGRLQVGRPQRA